MNKHCEVCGATGLHYCQGKLYDPPLKHAFTVQPAQPTPDDESVIDEIVNAFCVHYGNPDVSGRLLKAMTPRLKPILARYRHQAEEQAAARALEGAIRKAEQLASECMFDAETHGAHKAACGIRALLPSSFTSKGGA